MLESAENWNAVAYAAKAIMKIKEEQIVGLRNDESMMK